MGNELVLDQFEAGESIIEVPSIIGAILPVDLGVGGHGLSGHEKVASSSWSGDVIRRKAITR